MSPNRRWVIGRAPDCDLVVNSADVSARHCCLTETEQGFVLEDLKSTNGTFIDGTRITRARVAPGQRVTLGASVLMPWPNLAGSEPAPTVVAAARPQGQVPSTATLSAVITVGRAADNNVVLDYPMVSQHHARITVVNGRARIEDLGSTNGTALSHPERRIKQADLGPDDVVFFGSLRVPVARLLSGKLALGEQPHLNVSFRGQSMVFGRDPTCEQVLNYPMVSRRHARLSRIKDKLILEDLGSTNGTFANGKRVQRPVPVKGGDVISIGSFTFTLTSEGNLEKRDERGNLTLEANGITVEVPGKRLIENISLTIFPSEFVGLMGPSGAGKTTLMNALNGYTPPTAGEVLLNGQSVYAHYAQFAPRLGYVPQDDVIHRDLTVGQALYYSARLRLPPDFRNADIQARIGEVLRQLGLEGTEEVLIGSPEKKGISGGQRKRVNLAMELLTDPLVLFLDEPTSGLSSEDALMVMKVLRGLADAGKTILLTIHQPSLEVYRLMDNLVLVARDPGAPGAGKLVYYGPAYPDAVHFFNPDGLPGARPGVDPSPDEVLRGLAKRPTAEWEQRYAASRYRQQYVTERANQHPTTLSAARSATPTRLFEWSQWWTLVCRCLAIKVKDTWNSTILMAQAPIIAILIVLVFSNQGGQKVTDVKSWQEVAGSLGAPLFLLVLAALWFGCSNAVREIVGEWAVYRRERMVNLQIPSYVASKFTVLSGLCLVQCLVLLTIAYWGCGLQGPWLGMFLLLFLVSLVGVAMGLMVSALARTSEVAIALVPLLLLPKVILGGVMMPVHKMPGFPWVISHVMASRWAYEGLLVLEGESRPRRPPLTGPAPPEKAAADRGSTPKDGKADQPIDMAENYFPKAKHRSTIGLCALAMLLMLLVLIAAILVILRARDVHSKELGLSKWLVPRLKKVFRGGGV
jgi:ABC-type multidrug transport system ATPase subunit